MRPRKLRLFNIGPFAGFAEIDFTRLDDIFLISGKTGSGKTTIFDALCFALYGKLPGGRKNLEPRIRSDYSSLEEDCWVELEFSLANRVYLVQRSPRLERPKKRGTGTTTEDENAVLYQLTETGEKRSLSSRKSEADEKIVQLLGLSAEEFAKIVLLPQGEFAQFLQQNSQARREVLKKLFPVDIATAIQACAVEKRREAEAQVRLAQIELNEASNLYNANNDRLEAERIQNELKILKDDECRLIETMKQISEQLSLARQIAELRRRLETITLEKKHLEAQSSEIEKISTALERNQRAKPAQELLFRERELAQQRKVLTEERERAKDRANKATSQSNLLEGQKNEMEALAQEAKGLREQKGALTQAAEEEQRLMQLQNRLKNLRSAIAEAEKALPELQNQTAQLQFQLEACEEAARKERSLQEQKEVSLTLREQLRNLLQTAQSWEQKKPEQETAKKNLTNLKAELDEIERRLPELTAELIKTETALKQRELEAISARLAATLQEGTPCPVCGSIHHPMPARAPDPLDDLENRLSDLKREQRTLEDRRTELRTEIRNKSLIAETLDRELEGLLGRYQQIRSTLQTILDQRPDKVFPITSIASDSHIPTVTEVQEDIRKNSTLAETIGRELQQASKESQNQSRIVRTLQDKQQQRASLQTKLEQDRKQEAELILQINQQSGQLQQYLERWKTETIVQALKLLQSRLETLERDLSAYESRKQQVDKEQAQANQQLEETEKRWKAYEEAVQDNQQELLAMVGQLSFESLDDLKQALLAPEKEEAYTAKERAWKDDLKRLQNQENETQQTLESLRSKKALGNAEESPENLEAKLAKTELERKKLQDAKEALLKESHNLEQNRERYQKALTQFETLNKTLSRYRALADDLSGNNSKKWPFDSWLLSLYLQEVTGYANRRLERMSEGRYSIILNPEGEGGRALAGLDLAVFDAYTGRTRPCATLSGGETFMASISLALGLADSIQCRSGAVRLDAIFIDEGFGSLDEVSLDRALTILDEIRDHRMVGLISHVNEMKSRIPSKIEVIKSNQGSKILIDNKS